jgi:hypothetical protein
MKIAQVADKLKYFIITQVDSMAKTTPLLNIVKPLVSRVIDNNFNKVYSALNLIADSNGEIDIENIISEMMDNLAVTSPFVLHTSFIGDMELGNGLIKINIPFTDKRIVFNRNDIENLKLLLTSNTE